VRELGARRALIIGQRIPQGARNVKGVDLGYHLGKVGISGGRGAGGRRSRGATHLEGARHRWDGKGGEGSTSGV